MRSGETQAHRYKPDLNPPYRIEQGCSNQGARSTVTGGYQMVGLSELNTLL